jgi:hypothetical protein
VGSTAVGSKNQFHLLGVAGGPILPGDEGVGQVMWFKDLPRRIVAPNITPDPETGAGNWTDDQLARAIREGMVTTGARFSP